MVKNGETLGKITTEGPQSVPVSFDLKVGQVYGNIGVTGASTGLIELDPKINFARLTLNSSPETTRTVSQGELGRIRLGKPKPPYGRVEFMGLNCQPVIIKPAENS